MQFKYPTTTKPRLGHSGISRDGGGGDGRGAGGAAAGIYGPLAARAQPRHRPLQELKTIQRVSEEIQPVYRLF